MLADKDFTDDILAGIRTTISEKRATKHFKQVDMIETIMEQSSTKYQQVRP